MKAIAFFKKKGTSTKQLAFIPKWALYDFHSSMKILVLESKNPPILSNSKS